MTTDPGYRFAWDNLQLKPARDYNRRLDRHNPYLPKSVEKMESKRRAKN